MLSFLWRERDGESLRELAIVPGAPQVTTTRREASGAALEADGLDKSKKL